MLIEKECVKTLNNTPKDFDAKHKVAAATEEKEGPTIHCVEDSQAFQETFQKTREVNTGCISCTSKEFNAEAWGQALQQLVGGPRAAVSVELGGASCRKRLKTPKDKAALLAVAATAADEAARCCEALLHALE